MPHWMLYAGSEGLLKTASRFFVKPIGELAEGASGSLVSTGIIGIIQCIGGLSGLLIQKTTLWSDRVRVGSALTSGIFAGASTLFGTLAFTYAGANFGIITFLTLLSIIPGALFDRVFFGVRLKARQLVAILTYLLALWAMFNFADLTFFLNMPIWVVCGLLVALMNGSNEVVAKVAAQLRPDEPAHSMSESLARALIYNFWVGLSTTVFVAGALLFVGFPPNIFALSHVFWIFSIIVGVIVLFMIISKYLTYKTGGDVAFKLIIMQATHLITAVIIGAVLFQESITIGTGVGIVLFSLAFILMKDAAWERVRAFLIR